MIINGREIEFRGKSIENGKWIYSSAIANGAIKRKRDNKYMLQEELSTDYHDEWVEVIPETVGQFTGMKDVSGGKIFVDDVVKYSRVHYSLVGLEHWSKGVGLVIYDNFQSRHVLVPIGSGYEQSLCTDHKSGESTKLIGNVTDNPELLEAENASK